MVGFFVSFNLTPRPTQPLRKRVAATKGAAFILSKDLEAMGIQRSLYRGDAPPLPTAHGSAKGTVGDRCRPSLMDADSQMTMDLRHGFGHGRSGIGNARDESNTLQASFLCTSCCLHFRCC